VEIADSGNNHLHLRTVKRCASLVNIETQMDADEITDAITRAEGFAMLGMYSDVWEEIESLPPGTNARLHPSAIAVRLKVCAGLKNGRQVSRYVNAQKIPATPACTKPQDAFTCAWWSALLPNAN
jgi:hypothetical protein